MTFVKDLTTYPAMTSTAYGPLIHGQNKEEVLKTAKEVFGEDFVYSWFTKQHYQELVGRISIGQLIGQFWDGRWMALSTKKIAWSKTMWQRIQKGSVTTGMCPQPNTGEQDNGFRDDHRT